MNYSDDNEQHSVATHRANQIIQQMGGRGDGGVGAAPSPNMITVL